MEKMPEIDVLEKKNGYPFTDFEIQDFEKLQVGTIVEFLKDGKVHTGKIVEINSISDIRANEEVDNGTFSYGHTVTLSYEDIKHSS